ncbi:MAG: response regulator [Candidatus Sumerlaeaceae bacterium]
MSPSNQFRVVAIDDDKDILDLVHLTLGTDYEVFTLSDPALALEALEYIEPDVVLVDVMMPKVTGYHIVEKIRKDPRHQQVQVVFLSAKDSILDVKYGYKLGANFYLTKPFQPERVRRTLEMLLTQGGISKPRAKLLSHRDIELRLQTRMTVPAAARGEANLESAEPRPSSIHRIPKSGDDEPEQSKEKKWVG